MTCQHVFAIVLQLLLIVNHRDGGMPSLRLQYGAIVFALNPL